jgi:murein hydrolase activator
VTGRVGTAGGAGAAAFWLVAWLLLSFAAGTAFAESPARLRQEKARLEEAKREAARKADELAEAIRRERTTRKRVSELTSRLNQKRREIARMDQRLTGLNREIMRQEARVRALEEEKSRKEQEISVAALLAFMIARDGKWGAFREARDERLRYFARRVLEEELLDYGRLAASKEEVEAKLTGTVRELSLSERRRGREERVGERLASQQEEHARRLREIAREKERKEKELAALRARIAGFESLISRIERMVREQEQQKRRVPPGATKFSAVPGGLTQPLSGRIVTRFGKLHDPVFGVDLENRGVEIEAAAGSPIRAIGAGEVVFVGTVPGFGNVLILQHGSGLFSVYGKAGSYMPRHGQRVATGEVIGRLPSNPGGKSVLYLELRAAGTAIDPLSVIAFPR